MSKHDDIYEDRVKSLEPEDLYANAIYRLTDRIVKLEVANAHLIGACEKGLTWFRAKGIFLATKAGCEEITFIVELFEAAIANSKGDRRIDT